jgi:Sugar diacid utilization regulator
MISVKNILQLPALKSLEIVAGQSGIENKVGYVTVMEVPDIIRWLQGNDFLITSLYSVREDVKVQCSLIEELSKSSCSCVAIKTGQYVKDISEELKQTADECGLPLIKIPYDVPYIDIIMTIMTSILEEKNMDAIIEKYIKDVIFDSYDDESLMIERGRPLGILVEENFYISMNFSFPKGFEPNQKDMDNLVRAGKTLAHFTSHHSEISYDALLFMKNHISVIFESLSREAIIKSLSFIEKEALKQLQYYLPDIPIKVGFGTIEKNLQGIKHTYFNSLKAIRTGNLFQPEERVYYYEDMEMYCILNNIITDDTKEFSHKILNKITSKEIRNTLNAYYECNANIEKTAERLYMHKNTIKYRLLKIQEMTGLDIKNNDENFKLYLAVLIDKIHKNGK